MPARRFLLVAALVLAGALLDASPADARVGPDSRPSAVDRAFWSATGPTGASPTAGGEPADDGSTGTIVFAGALVAVAVIVGLAVLQARRPRR